MMARAVAKEMGFRFLVVKPSVVNNKWVGESEKTIQAIFSLGIGFDTRLLDCDVWYLTKESASLHLSDKNSCPIIFIQRHDDKLTPVVIRINIFDPLDCPQPGDKFLVLIIFELSVNRNSIAVEIPSPIWLQFNILFTLCN